jgi:hypothetical protein
LNAVEAVERLAGTHQVSAGLNKLTTDELNALDRWFIKTLMNFAQRAAETGRSSCAVPGTYPVEASV